MLQNVLSATIFNFLTLPLMLARAQTYKDQITKLKAERDALRPPEEREKAKAAKEAGAQQPGGANDFRAQIEAAQKKIEDLTENYVRACVCVCVCVMRVCV